MNLTEICDDDQSSVGITEDEIRFMTEEMLNFFHPSKGNIPIKEAEKLTIELIRLMKSAKEGDISPVVEMFCKFLQKKISEICLNYRVQKIRDLTKPLGSILPSIEEILNEKVTDDFSLWIDDFKELDFSENKRHFIHQWIFAIMKLIAWKEDHRSVSWPILTWKWAFDWVFMYWDRPDSLIDIRLISWKNAYLECEWIEWRTYVSYDYLLINNLTDRLPLISDLNNIIKLNSLREIIDFFGINWRMISGVNSFIHKKEPIHIHKKSMNLWCRWWSQFIVINKWIWGIQAIENQLTDWIQNSAYRVYLRSNKKLI